MKILSLLLKKHVFRGDVAVLPLIIIAAIVAAIPLTISQINKQQTTESQAQVVGGGGGKGAIAGQVWQDTDGNKKKGSNEFGMPGVVRIEATGPVYRSVMTNLSTASYLIKDLPPGTYTVRATGPDNFRHTTSRTMSRDVSAGQTVYSNFGFQRISTQPTIAPPGGGNSGNNNGGNNGDTEGGETVAGDVFLDADGDGKRDGNERFISTTVELKTTGDDTLAVTSSNSDGDFKFTDIAPGTYVLHADYQGRKDEAVVNVTEGFSIKTRLGISDGDSSNNEGSSGNNDGNTGSNDNGGNTDGNSGNDGGETVTKVNLSVIIVNDANDKALRDVRIGVDPDGAGYRYTNSSGKATFPVTKNTTVSINAYLAGYEKARITNVKVTKDMTKTISLEKIPVVPTATIRPTEPEPSISPSVPSTLGRNADIIVSSFRLTDASGNIKTNFAKNEPIYALVSFKNQGTEKNYSYAGKFLSSIYASCPTPKSEDTVSDVGMSLSTPLIDPGLTQSFGSTTNNENAAFFRGHKSFTVQQPGTYTACAYANSNHSAREKNFQNNQKTITYTIEDTSPPPPTATPTTPQQKISMQGFVFIDANQNGEFNQGVDYAAPSGFNYQITAVNQTTNTTSIATTANQGNGGFIFTNLPEGTYKVSYTNVPQNYRITTPQPSSYTVSKTGNTCTVTPDTGATCTNTGVTGLLFGTTLIFTQPSTPTKSPTPSLIAETITPSPTGQACIQVITHARNTTTNACQTFPDGCLPSGWVADSTCTPTSSVTTTPPSSDTTSLRVSFSLNGVSSSGNNNEDREITANAVDLSTPDNDSVSGEGTMTYNADEKTYDALIIFDKHLEPGIYLITVRTPRYEAKQLAGTLVIAPDGTASMSNIQEPVRLLAGDIDNDGNITIFDYNLLTSCMSTLTNSTTNDTCSPQMEVQTDLNEDGTVNQIDYNLFLRSVRESALNPNSN